MFMKVYFCDEYLYGYYGNTFYEFGNVFLICGYVSLMIILCTDTKIASD